VKIPKQILEGKSLNIYAVQTRYPGDYETVYEKEYKNAVETSEMIVNWVEKIIKADK
jgi:HEPN domain-containing protein